MQLLIRFLEQLHNWRDVVQKLLGKLTSCKSRCKKSKSKKKCFRFLKKKTISILMVLQFLWGNSQDQVYIRCAGTDY